MNEREMTLGTDWDGEKVAGMFASEKLDGCRGFWDGERLWTRGGNIVNLPSVTSQLPRGFRLDGEIYAGRANFTAARLATQFGKVCAGLRFVAFDSPDTKGGWMDRMNAARRVWGDCVTGWIVKDFDALFAQLRTIQRDGGEGIVLRSPYVQKYEKGRTKNLVKVFHARFASHSH